MVVQLYANLCLRCHPLLSCSQAVSSVLALLQESIVIVEYPKRLAHLVRDTLGPLSKMRDRRYGRTFIAIYGPKGLEAEE